LALVLASQSMMSPQPGAASEPPTYWTDSAAHRLANDSRCRSGHSRSVPSTKAAPNTSPAPVGSCAFTGSEGTHSCSPVIESMPSAPCPPQVTTATGTRSASLCSASCGSSVCV
jgi:hypothetical protein